MVLSELGCYLVVDILFNLYLLLLLLVQMLAVVVVMEVVVRN
jgi:hypothetical protein